ncbi:MarR family transcriptional regulator [Candidatus Woesearchaeota archaeon]|nr:MarR family transcriptional regulator [Candidatus Woesearchaeota archaeon]
MPDEKIAIGELEKNNGALTQSELVRNTGLSKVKVHRIVKRLESLGIVKKYPYGVTNKIKLEKILDDE